ncbi:9454_t:CDS:2 [Dentiscutata erythropus]|uniref:9454_t:CDS:1 n=1 Tax=Dentiscutata erythropus TaxID=1348616 RepID=A0A9N8ZC19_9GLOM|nr:9454_t:CDS:2 [Dentiscutata erythropus]
MNKVFTFFGNYLSCLPTIFSNGSIKNSEVQTVVAEPNYRPMNIRLELIQTNNGFEIKRNDLTDSVDSRSKKEKPINIRLEVDPTNNSIEIKPNDSTNNDTINNSTSSNSSKNSINIQLELVPVNNVINSNDSRPTNNEFVDIALPKSNTTESKFTINPNYISTDPQLTEDVLYSFQLEETLKNTSTDPSYNDSTNIQLKAVPLNNSIETDSIDLNMDTLDLQVTTNPEDVSVEKELTVSDVLNKRKSYQPINLQSIQGSLPEEMHLNNAMDIELDSLYMMDLQFTTNPEDVSLNNTVGIESVDFNLDTLCLQLTTNPEDIPVEKELTISDVLNKRKSYIPVTSQSIQDTIPEEMHLNNAIDIEHDSTHILDLQITSNPEDVSVNNTIEKKSVDFNMDSLDFQFTTTPEDAPVEKDLTVSDVLNKRKSYHPIRSQSIIPEEMHLNNAMDIEHDSTDNLDLQLSTNPEDVPVEQELTASDILNERKDVLPEELHLKNSVEIRYDSDGFTIYDNSSETGHASTDDWDPNNFLNDWADDWNQNHVSTDDWADDSNRQDHSADVWDVDYFTDDLKVIHVDDHLSIDNCTDDDDLSHKDHLVDVWDLDYFTDTLNDVEDLTDIVIFNEEDPTDFLNSKDDDVKVPIIVPTIDAEYKNETVVLKVVENSAKEPSVVLNELKTHQSCRSSASELLSTVWDWYVKMTDGTEIQKQFADSDKKIKKRAMDKIKFHSGATYTSKFIPTGFIRTIDHLNISDTLPSKPICTLDINP